MKLDDNRLGKTMVACLATALFNNTNVSNVGGATAVLIDVKPSAHCARCWAIYDKATLTGIAEGPLI
jgi:hypothetical protein